MSEFYTYVNWSHNKIAVSGYYKGQKFNHKVDYQPYLFRNTHRGTGDYQTVTGIPVERIDFDNITEAREFAKQMAFSKDVYGLTNYPYTYIYDTYKDIKFDPKLLRVGNFDIETDSQNGFGNFTRTQIPDRQITSITIKVHGQPEIYVFGLKPYHTITDELINGKHKIIYYHCESERELLARFINRWVSLKLDVVTGWNINSFDIVYLIRRIDQILSMERARMLSPFNQVEQREYVSAWGRQMTEYVICGVPILDYMLLYQKFMGREESFKLDYIAGKILKLNKLDYSEYGSLAKLYDQNHDKFIDYNIIDVLRVEQLDDFLKLIHQMIEMAHIARVNFNDIFGTIRPWDIMIHNYLMDQKIVIPFAGKNIKERQIAGGFVKQPDPGKYPYVMSFDLTSLYPHLFMQYNISPETLCGKFEPIAGEFSVDKIIAGEMNKYRQELIDNKLTVSGKGTVFSTEKIGFLPALMKNLFQERKKYKTLMLGKESKLQDVKTEMARRGITV